MFQTRSGFQLQGTCTDEHSGVNSSSSSVLAPGSFRLHTRSHPMANHPFASISSTVLSNLGKASESGSGRTEPHTGYDFPLEYCYLKKSKCPSLTGLGVRSKHILVKTINVYALGIYVDTAAAKSALSSFKSKKPDDLEADQTFYDALLAAPHVEKTLRLVISSRLVDRKKFLDALDERLAPRLKKEGEPATLDAFRAQFDGVTFEKGMEIAFVCQDNKKLVTEVGGQQKGSIASAALCKSLFDVYLGSDPASKDAKSTFGRNLATALNE